MDEGPPHQIPVMASPSPDLDPIENLWNVVKRKMDSYKPSNKEELLTFLYQEWHKITQKHKDINLPEDVKQSLASEAEAQRNAKVKILAAECEKNCVRVSETCSREFIGIAHSSSAAANNAKTDLPKSDTDADKDTKKDSPML
ncbi:unnamed protein product [Ranitomeya imitator]|uniref:Tc1-like transposase DDE domain-containing protein n=1 Tax=Ranitomeya imitator TaxID=111125 RepID=A0ABN9KV33_9NEOB|nr:unnamed protein product [Ranitomeya imitator]